MCFTHRHSLLAPHVCRYFYLPYRINWRSTVVVILRKKILHHDRAVEFLHIFMFFVKIYETQYISYIPQHYFYYLSFFIPRCFSEVAVQNFNIFSCTCTGTGFCVEYITNSIYWEGDFNFCFYFFFSFLSVYLFMILE